MNPDLDNNSGFGAALLGYAQSEADRLKEELKYKIELRKEEKKQQKRMEEWAEEFSKVAHKVLVLNKDGKKLMDMLTAEVFKYSGKHSDKFPDTHSFIFNEGMNYMVKRLYYYANDYYRKTFEQK